VHENVEAGSNVYSDALKSYEGMNEFEHQVVDHAVEYVNGRIHTNGMENFWSLLNRGLHGAYISVEPLHLFRYVDEQAFRYSHRKDMKTGSGSISWCRRSSGSVDVQGTHREDGRGDAGAVLREKKRLQE
jgi:hypothetical protein